MPASFRGRLRTIGFDSVFRGGVAVLICSPGYIGYADVVAGTERTGDDCVVMVRSAGLLILFGLCCSTPRYSRIGYCSGIGSKVVMSFGLIATVGPMLTGWQQAAAAFYDCVVSSRVVTPNLLSGPNAKMRSKEDHEKRDFDVDRPACDATK